MLFVNQLTEEEKITLHEACKHHPLSWAGIRAHCILLSDEYYQIKDIASILNICRQSVSTCIHNWEDFGFSGIVDAHRSGRPPVLTEGHKEKLIEKIKENPRSLKKVLAEFSETHHIEISLSTLRRICKEAKLSWKRIRKSLKSKRNEEEFERSKALINDLIIAWKAEEINLHYFDESGFSLTPCIPYAWQPEGEYIGVPSSRSHNINVLGFVDRDCNFESFVFTGRITADVVIGCFDRFAADLDKPTVVLLDNAPIHTSVKFDNKTIEWCKKGLIIVPISRYSPELNIIEIIWRKMKYEWIPFSAYESFDALKESLNTVLGNIGAEYKVRFC